MHKILTLIEALNEIDLGIHFVDKTIQLIYNDQELVTIELPVGIDNPIHFIKLIRIAIIEKIDTFEEWETRDSADYKHLEILKLARQHV